MADDAVFDPSKPFDDLTPPQFDPSKPFEPEPAPLTWSDVPGKMVENAPSSLKNLATNMVQPVLHPIQTVESISNVARGYGEKAGLLSGEEHKKHAEAVNKFFGDRYGGLENFKQTLATDPFGVAADLATIASGGELVATRVPGMIGEVGRAAGMVGRAVDPVNIALKTAKGIGEAVSPGLQDARALTAAGVKDLTPGQTVGGLGKGLEDAATSLPITGTLIQQNRQRALESFNKAAGNQALDEIGESLNPTTRAGHDAIAEVDTKISNAYDRLLPQLNWIPDKQFHADMANLYRRELTLLPPNQAAAFENFINQRMGMSIKDNPTAPGNPTIQTPAPMNGQMFKSVESELKNRASQYLRSSDVAEQDVGRALRNTVKAMKANLERSNPAQAAELAQINSAWAMHSRMADAAERASATDGIFMPNQLLNAIKTGEKKYTGSNKSFARGDGLMQAFAEAGQRVLPSKLPSSGTTERAAIMAAIGGSAWWLGRPEILAAYGATALPYTRTGKAALQAAANIAGSPAARNIVAFQAGRASQIPQITVPRQALPGEQRAHGGKVMPDGEKKTHSSVHYVAKSPHKNKSCGLCSMFVPEGPACTLVQSPIASAGYCNRFAGRK